MLLIFRQRRAASLRLRWRLRRLTKKSEYLRWTMSLSSLCQFNVMLNLQVELYP